MNIFLIGYMGSGKSVIGKKLSEVLKYSYLDLDDYIQLKEGKTITEIFKEKGEIYFRKIESKYLNEVIADKFNTVISLGGGTPCYGKNMSIIKNADNASSIYLKASIFVLAERLFLEKNHRPLISHIQDKNELIEFIGKHMFERSPYYIQSDITINTDKKSIDEVIESIVLKLF
jgi:shikimate kinase